MRCMCHLCEQKCLQRVPKAVKCQCVLHDDIGQKNRTTRYNCRLSAASLALRVIFSVSQLWNIFGSFTEPFNCLNRLIISSSERTEPAKKAGQTNFVVDLVLALFSIRVSMTQAEKILVRQYNMSPCRRQLKRKATLNKKALSKAQTSARAQKSLLLTIKQPPGKIYPEFRGMTQPSPKHLTQS